MQGLDGLLTLLLFDPIVLEELINVIVLFEAVLDAILVQDVVAICLIVHICRVVIKVILLCHLLDLVAAAHGARRANVMLAMTVSQFFLGVRPDLCRGLHLQATLVSTSPLAGHWTCAFDVRALDNSAVVVGLFDLKLEINGQVCVHEVIYFFAKLLHLFIVFDDGGRTLCNW